MSVDDTLLAAMQDDDIIVPFSVESMPVRGRVARLGPAADRILSAHDYPAQVKRILGEALALSAMLGSALKFEGIFTLQAQGAGPISLVVVDYESHAGANGRVRGYASFDAAAVAALGAGPSSIPQLFGTGTLALTIDPELGRDRYQGIVPLDGEDLAACARHYFTQSEQIPTHVALAVAQHFTRDLPQGVWRASGLMIQYVPGEGGVGETSTAPEDDDVPDEWVRATLLADTVGADELVDPNLSPDRLLYRLFHQEGVRVFATQPVVFGCRCAREKIEGVLKAYPRADLVELAQDGTIETRCEFCSTAYVFTLDELSPQT